MAGRQRCAAISGFVRFKKYAFAVNQCLRSGSGLHGSILSLAPLGCLCANFAANQSRANRRFRAHRLAHQLDAHRFKKYAFAVTAGVTATVTRSPAKCAFSGNHPTTARFRGYRHGYRSTKQKPGSMAGLVLLRCTGKAAGAVTAVVLASASGGSAKNARAALLSRVVPARLHTAFAGAGCCGFLAMLGGVGTKKRVGNCCLNFHPFPSVPIRSHPFPQPPERKG